MEILQVTKLNHKGEGVTAGGFFIPRTLPGEKVSFRPDLTVNIIEPANNRISAICKHYKNCGGCS
ncbi:MAG: 23S rRNA (uracil1939-C5)-methyltransferase, partial [Paracoccaceae bacterium]